MSPEDRVRAGREKVLAVAEQGGAAVGSPTRADPCLVLGRVAALLAEQGSTQRALAALVEGLHLRTAVLRDSAGTVIAGDAAPEGPRVELPVHGRSGALLGLLTVSGAVPSQLPVLRSAAAVLGLAMTPPADSLEDDRDALADALHDGPVQSLVVARYASDAAVRGGDVTAARDAVQAALVEVRRFLWNLRPRGGTGLLDAVEQLSGHLVEAGGPALGLVGDVEAAAALRGDASVLAYRLVQAVATADAPAVRISLRTDGARLVVDLEGGAPLTPTDGWLRRAQSLGGDLTTSAGRIRLVLPHPEARTSP